MPGQGRRQSSRVMRRGRCGPRSALEARASVGDRYLRLSKRHDVSKLSPPFNCADGTGAEQTAIACCPSRAWSDALQREGGFQRRAPAEQIRLKFSRRARRPPPVRAGPDAELNHLKPGRPRVTKTTSFAAKRQRRTSRVGAARGGAKGAETEGARRMDMTQTRATFISVLKTSARADLSG